MNAIFLLDNEIIYNLIKSSMFFTNKKKYLLHLNCSDVDLLIILNTQV